MYESFFDETMILNLASDCFYGIPEQWETNKKFFLDRLPRYQDFDRLYDCFLENEALFFKFLDHPQKFEPDDYHQENELVFIYHEYLNIFLAYYILRINGIEIYTQPELRRIDELVNFATPFLFEEKGRRLVLSENIVSLLRSVIILGKVKFLPNDDTFVFLIKVFAAAGNDDAEIDDLYTRVYAEVQYQIKRIIYRKNHDQFSADDFLRKALPFDLWENLGAFEKEIPDITLFENLVKSVLELERSPKLLMSVSIQLARMSEREDSSFLARIANSRDDDLKQIQRKVIMDLYNRAIGEEPPAVFEFYSFLEFCFILKNAESEFFGNPVYLKEITAKCTKFLNSLRFIHRLGLTDDEQMFYYDCANNVAWFLKNHYSHWKGVKLLLNAFRASKDVWVNPNLSYNGKFGSQNLAFLITKYFIAKPEEALKQLRQEMANGLADLLKPIPENRRNAGRENSFPAAEKSLPGFDINLFEPNPLFRYAYVRAIGDLGVDSDGKGHFIHTILDNAAVADPDQKVRDAAGTVSKKLKKLNDGWKKGNHKRFLNEAYWWIRRAHVLTLNEKFDEKAANEYRILKSQEYKSKGRIYLPFTKIL